MKKTAFAVRLAVALSLVLMPAAVLAYNPVKHIAYGVGTEGCFSQTGATVAALSPEGGVDRQVVEMVDATHDSGS